MRIALTVVLRWNKEAFRWMMLDRETRTYEIVDMPMCGRFKKWSKGMSLRKDMDNVVDIPAPVLTGYKVINSNSQVIHSLSTGKHCRKRLKKKG